MQVLRRRSSDLLAVRDPRMVKWLNLLQQNLKRLRSAKEFAQLAGVSRRVLERRFRETLDRGVFEEMTRLRIMKANTLMHDTNWPLGRISEECGFGDARTFSLTYRKLEGETPSQRRRRMTPETSYQNCGDENT